MESIIAQYLEEVKRKHRDELDKSKNDIKKIEKIFKKASDELSNEGLKRYLEGYDQELKLDENRNPDYVVQRTVGKNITTLMGTFRLNRTKYYDKANKRYFCLLDEKLNIPAYEHMTPNTFARMCKLATYGGYGWTGREINSRDVFSKGMIYQKIKNIDVEMRYESLPVKRRVRVLYVNLDEDHISLQKCLKKKSQCKIGYVYEGIVKVCKNRYKLTHKHVITGMYQKSSGNRAFYEDMWKYIESHYDVDFLEKIIVYGDGAKWITASTDYLPKSEFRLDKFHLMKSILEATRTIENDRKRLKKNILRCLYENNEEMFVDLIDDTIRQSNKAEKVLQTRDYILNNWEAIQRTITSADGSGCSAEGNVSHILSARLSQKGIGWCEHNADVIGKFRGIQANDGDDAFIDMAEYNYYQRTHYCKDSNVIKYTYRAKQHYDINKSYVERMQATIPDYYINRAFTRTEEMQ